MGNTSHVPQNLAESKLNEQSLFQWHSWHVSALQTAWICNGDHFIFLGFAWTQHPISYFLTGLQFPQSGSQFTMPLRGRDADPGTKSVRMWKGWGKDWHKGDTVPTCSEGLRVKPFHSVNISVPQESKFKLSCMNAIYKIHNPLSLAVRLSPAVSAKRGELSMTKNITGTASLLLLLCFTSLSLVPVGKKEKKEKTPPDTVPLSKRSPFLMHFCLTSVPATQCFTCWDPFLKNSWAQYYIFSST